MKDYPYPKDEFDEPPAPGQPVGVHLPRRGTWDRLRAFVIVLVVAALLAYGIVWWFSTQTTDDAPAASPTATTAPADPTEAPATGEEPGEPTDEATDEESEEPSDEPTTDEPTTDEPDELDQSVSVRVLNSTRTSGLAATVAQTLLDGGWSGAEAANFTGTPPSVTSVWYQSEEYADEAEAIAEALGVERATLVESLRGPISVILRPDYQG